MEQPAEWRLLVMACRPGEQTVEQASRLIDQDGVDPDRLIGMAARHGLVPLLAAFLEHTGRVKVLQAGGRRHVRDALERNRDRTRRHVSEARRITGRLRRSGLAVAVTKGVTAQATLYGQDGTRTFNDIDLMVLPEQRSAVAQVLESLGYRPGAVYRHQTGDLAPLPRNELLMYKLYPDHLPHFTRLTGDASLPYFVTDVAFSLTWHAAPWQIPTGSALAGPLEVDVTGGQLPAMHPVFDFLFLCLHLFREAWFAPTIRAKGLRLIQFTDIGRHWDRRSRHHAGELVAAIERFGLAAPVGWAVSHTDEIFGTAIGPALGLSGRYGPGWLNSACESPGRYLWWPGTMSERLARYQTPELLPHPDPGRVASLLGACRPDPVRVPPARP